MRLRWTADRLRSGEGVGAIGLGADRAPPDLVSEQALRDHYALYLGYVDAFNRAAAGAPPETHGCPRTASFLVGAVALHEAYFLGVAASHPPPGDGPLVHAIWARFGGIDPWWDEMSAAARCARGWAILGADRDRSLHVVTLDTHDVGSEPDWEPVCVVDAYEHAYWRDFGPDRPGYLDVLSLCLDWPEMERRYAGAWR